MAALLEAAGLCKSFDAPAGKLQVLRDVAFEIRSGEFLSMVGESGSGKSTLLQILGTLDRPDAGDIRLDGESLTGIDERRRAALRNEKVGFVYQAHHLIPELTALENVMLPQLVQGKSAAEAARRAADLLSRLHLGERQAHTPARLSGGEAQRVAVARALANRPCLLLADEPTGNLDEKTAREVFAMLRQLCREEHAAVLMVTHSAALAEACDRRLTLREGRIHSR